MRDMLIFSEKIIWLVLVFCQGTRSRRSRNAASGERRVADLLSAVEQLFYGDELHHDWDCAINAPARHQRWYHTRSKTPTHQKQVLQMFLSRKEIHRSPLAACERTAAKNLVRGGDGKATGRRGILEAYWQNRRTPSSGCYARDFVRVMPRTGSIGVGAEPIPH